MLCPQQQREVLSSTHCQTCWCVIMASTCSCTTPNLVFLEPHLRSIGAEHCQQNIVPSQTADGRTSVGQNAKTRRGLVLTAEDFQIRIANWSHMRCPRTNSLTLPLKARRDRSASSVRICRFMGSTTAAQTSDGDQHICAAIEQSVVRSQHSIT